MRRGTIHPTSATGKSIAAVDCPTCGAQPGNKCFVLSARATFPTFIVNWQNSHIARFAKARIERSKP